MPSEQMTGIARGELAAGSCCLAVSDRLAGRSTGSCEIVSCGSQIRHKLAYLCSMPSSTSVTSPVSDMVMSMAAMGGLEGVSSVLMAVGWGANEPVL